MVSLAGAGMYGLQEADVVETWLACSVEAESGAGISL